MKKILFILLGGVILFLASCAKEQCNCDLNGDQITFTESDAKDAGLDLFTYCENQDVLAKVSSPANNCSIN